MPTTPPRNAKSSGVRPPCCTAAVTGVPSANSGHCSAIPSTMSTLWEPAASYADVPGAAPATVLPTPRTFSAAEPSIGMDMTLEHGPSLDRGKTPACRTLGSLPRHATPEGRYPPQRPPRRPQEPSGRLCDLHKTEDIAQDNRHVRRLALQCAAVYFPQ